MSAQYTTKIQNLPQFTIKCHPIQAGIHKDPSVGVLIRIAYDIVMAAGVVPAIVYVQSPNSLGKESLMLEGVVKEFC